MGAKVSSSRTVRAVVRESAGLVFKPDYVLPMKELTAGEVVIRVHAAAINPVDYKAPKMMMGPVVGLDVAGVVEAVGEATTLKVGDEVYGNVRGSLADYVICNEKTIAKKPKSLSFTEAAAMPVAYLTSLQALQTYGKLKAGGNVLVIGASGGCGTAALQLAKAFGANEIVGVCSGKNEEYAKGHGATSIVDYTKTSLPEVYPESSTIKFDVVYDAATNSGGGEDYKAQGLKLLCSAEGDRAHGQYVAINGAVSMWLRKMTIGQKANEHLFLTDANTADLDTLARLVDEGAGESGGRLAPVIQNVFDFTKENVDKGFELLKSRRVVGKVVFDMKVSAAEDPTEPAAPATTSDTAATS